MRRAASPIFLLLLLTALQAHAQFDAHRELPSAALQEGDVRFTVSGGISKFVTTRNRFLESAASLRFVSDRTEYGIHLRMNNQVEFELPVDHRTIDIDEHQVIFVDPNLLQNQSYRLSKPVSFTAGRQIGAFRVTADLSPVFRTERGRTPIVSQLDSSTFSITSYEDVREQADVVGGAVVSSEVGPLVLFGGVSSVSVAVIGDRRIRRSTALPFAGTGLKGEQDWFSIGTTGSDWRVQHLHQWEAPWKTGGPMLFRAEAFLHQRHFISRGGSAEVAVPISRRMQLQAGFTAVWGGGSGFSSTDLRNWYRSVSSPWDENMESRLPHSSAVVGVRYDLRTDDPKNDILLENFRMLQKDLYTAKREYYAYNAVAEITIRNSGAEPADCQMIVEIDGGLGSYRTDRMVLHPDERREVPLYLYLADHEIPVPAETRGLQFSIVEKGRSRVLTSSTVVMHDAHHWDGDTRNLRFFLDPEDPRIIASTRTALLSSTTVDSNLSLPQRMFSTLQRLITELGADLRAVSDPTTTMTTDRVQFPVETMELRAGDCEDLVVYLASCLMSVGYQCAAVDLQPVPSSTRESSKDIGHVFLLVDTGIESEDAASLGLSETAWASRRSSDGRTTIWIPLEALNVHEGFQKAFRSGAEQYYRYIVAPDILPPEAVRVVDF